MTDSNNDSTITPVRSLHALGIVNRLNQLSMDKIKLLTEIIPAISGSSLEDNEVYSIQEDAFDQFMVLDSTVTKLFRNLFFKNREVQNPPVIHDQSVSDRVNNAQEDRHGGQGNQIPPGNH